MRRKRWRIRIAASLLLLALMGGMVALAHPGVRWRIELLAMKAGGELIDMSWGELLLSLRGSRAYAVHDLLKTGNPNRAVVNRYTSPEDVAEGEELYRLHCALCHGIDGRGNLGRPELTLGRFEHGASDRAVFGTISEGIPGTEMSGIDLPAEQVWKLVSYVKTLMGVLPTGSALGSIGEPPGLTFERLLSASSEPENWLTYSGDYHSHRHSALDEISSENVGRLELRWVRQLETSEPIVEATPLVVGGIMYVTEPPNDVIALDASTGRELWRYHHRLPEDLPLCCGAVNRGVAVLDDRIFLGTLDAHLLALDARSGDVLWDVSVADHEEGFSITAAPLALRDRIVIGVAGGEFGIRGFLDAYDAGTGAHIWRFYTVPGPGEPGHESWTGDSWRTGGAPTWMTGSYDPDLDLIYWGVGNPAPPFSGEIRRGDNLYSNSVVALAAETGELKWFFQFTPHDEHDWDSNQIPVLVDLEIEGEPRELLLWANRNAFFYVLDRATGEFLRATQFARQNWAERIDAAGRPVQRPNTSPTAEGTLIWPGSATNWWSPSFSSRTGLFYVPVHDRPFVFFSHPDESYTPGESFAGSGIETASSGGEAFIRAIAPGTGAIVWEHRLSDEEAISWRMGGLLSTAGNLVFGGSGELFVALDARTGDELWRFHTGGRIAAAPISYGSEGRQYIAVAAGRSIFSFSLPPGR